MNKDQVHDAYIKLCTELGELSHKQNLINARMDQLRKELVSITALSQKLAKESADAASLEQLKSEEPANS